MNAASPVPEAPGSKLSNTALRFVSAAPLIPLIIWLLYRAPSWGFQLFILIGGGIVARELFRMVIPESKRLQVYGVLATLTVGAVRLFAPTIWPGHESELFGALLSGLAIGALVAGLCMPDPVETAASRTGWLLGGPIYVGATLSSMLVLHKLPYGGGWVLLTMFIAWFSDTLAYFAGRYFGKHKLYPKLSPKKTVEGALGGLTGSVIGGIGTHFFLVPTLPLVDAIALSLVAGAVGQAGDLFESLLKRSTGVKDSGSILPGHGGLLDRVDALMYTSTLTWLYATFILPFR